MVVRPSPEKYFPLAVLSREARRLFHRDGSPTRVARVGGPLTSTTRVPRKQGQTVNSIDKLQKKSLGSVLRATREELRAAGIESAGIDAELLVAHTTGMSRVQLRTRDDEVLEPAAVVALKSLVARRLQHEPVAYLIGRAGFRRIELEVDKRVLVPRPETELLVELAVAEIGARIAAARVERVGDEGPRQSIPVRVLDLCTGSGAIALAIADETAPGAAQISATDLSADAIDVARANGERLELDVAWHQGDLFAALPGGDGVAGGDDGDDENDRFDVIISNPPYIARSDADSLPPDVIAHEPHMALFLPGDDPGELLTRMLAECDRRLAPGGVFAVEIGADQHEAVSALLADHGLQDVRVVADLAGIGRVVTGRRG